MKTEATLIEVESQCLMLSDDEGFTSELFNDVCFDFCTVDHL